MSDQDSCPTDRLKVSQLPLEPFKLVAWVVPGFHDLEIEVIAAHCIKGDDPRFIIKGSSVF